MKSLTNMTTSSLPPFHCLLFQQAPLQKSSNPSLKTNFRRLIPRFITASVTENPSTSAPSPPRSAALPLREIPGNYGPPFFGPISDRQDYFYNQGPDEFFNSRIQKYNSTVLRVNMPPGPLISSNPNVVVLLDGKSFPVLFDMNKVEKKDLFTGTYMPSTDLTGGYRILSYLDPAEPSHAKIKNLLFFLLKSRRDHFIPEFKTTYGELFDKLESDISKNGKASFTEANKNTAFDYVVRAYFGSNPADSKLGKEGPTLVTKWIAFNLHPLLSVGLPKLLEELLLHTFSLPPFLVKGDYNKLYDFFYDVSGPVLEEAVKMGISKEEACHNLLFATCFNTYGGMTKLFPSMVKFVGNAGEEVHAKLAKEIRAAVKAAGGTVSMKSLEEMSIMKSAVYECLRIDPPVKSQYGRVKKDMIIESHEAAYEVKKGEMLFGYQPFATKDGKIFEKGDEFVVDRFVGEGEELLKHVVWSNGPETESPTVGNKQCAGKDFVVLMGRLFLVELFLRYDSFEVDKTGEYVTSLKKASS